MLKAALSTPLVRLRRTRQSSWIRALVRETAVTPADLVQPLFVIDGTNTTEPVASLPGVERYSIDRLVQRARDAHVAGVPAIALFPNVDPALKDERGSEATNPDSLICRAIQEIKTAVPDIGVIADVALDPYTTHGHDGLMTPDGSDVDNDATVHQLTRQALTLAAAGADAVAPSDMMDGRIAAIRGALEQEGQSNTLILAYTAKFASGFYGPFRDAVGSKSALGTAGKKTYQMDPANAEEALRSVRRDVAEGADMIMVKPGLPYLDVVKAAADEALAPVFAYQVSGEYAMLAHAAAAGAFDLQTALVETLLAFKRAGATGVLTYGAIDVARALQEA